MHINIICSILDILVTIFMQNQEWGTISDSSFIEIPLKENSS